MFNPVIDLDKCTACGFCIGVCPNDSIEIIIK
nr:4Fe-4S binding protein [Lebetimonas sp. JH369]